MTTTELICFARLALGRPGGRVSPADEDRLFRYIMRVMIAIEEGRDALAAFDVPLPFERRPLDAADQDLLIRAMLET